jgi:xanthine dehydrogenase YagS FAD-binding subunit
VSHPHPQPFRYHRATSLDDAARELAESGAAPLGGGTDLLVTVAEEIAHPSVVVDLRAIPESATIHEAGNGSLRIGGSARIDAIATHPLVRERYPMLAQACAAVGTPALRHMGTLGGNLCQRPRCWYFRQAIPCLKNGGSTCPAEAGENQYLAILDNGPCHIVHPSDPAVALTALDATVELTSAAGTRSAAMTELYLLPTERLDLETVLTPGEFISAVILSPECADGVQLYRKTMQRQSWDFALASVAGCRRGDGEVRIVLGGVAPKPWRVNSSVEEDVASGGLDEDAIATLAERALYDAKPLSKNGYKVELAAALLREAMRALG